MKFGELILCQFVMFVIYVCLNAYSFAYCLDATFSKNIPWYADAVVGLISGGLFIPLAVIAWVCQLCGIPTPFVGGVS